MAMLRLWLLLLLVLSICVGLPPVGAQEQVSKAGEKKLDAKQVAPAAANA